ncbi:MAG TPA: ribosome maturation factor RimM [Halomicronema sp.]
MTNENWLVIGTIVAAQGLDGQMRIYPNSDFPQRFLEPGQRWMRRNDSEEAKPIELLGGREVPGRGIYVVELAGIKNREDAEALRGFELLVPDTDRPVLEEGEYHVMDLIGLEVLNLHTNETIGKVVDVIPAGNDLLAVELFGMASETPPEEPQPVHPSARRGGRKRKVSKVRQPQVLIPFVNEIVPVVDLEAGRLEINPPPGLLEV